jgi:hypothetical protein
MNQRLSNMDASIMASREAVVQGFEGVQANFAHLLSTAITQEMLATMLRAGAGSGQDGGGRNGSGAAAAAAASTNASHPSTVVGYSKHRISVKSMSVSAIYNEWHRTGHFQDTPIEGGIVRLETSEIRKTWHRSFQTAENKLFSRFRLVIKGIGNHMQRAGKNSEETATS